MQRDWRNPEDYEFTRDLSPELWAWQFLRRNPSYQKDYDWFIATWRELEADYGVAPNRDFSRWKLDPRAYAPDEMTQDICEEDKSCASPDGDKVLIECAMGAKWGFYKFPNSPDVEFPDVPDKLIWRELDIGVDVPVSKAQLFEVDLRFDLRLPMKQQLASAKRQLITRQRQYQQQGEGFSVENLTHYLRLIDASHSPDQEIVDQLFEGDNDMLVAHRRRSVALRQTDYRLLAVSSIK